MSSAYRRLNLLTNQWVLSAPKRQTRPWQGDSKKAAEQKRSTHVCHLCPGHTRANGERNSDYKGVFVFDNDYPALSDDTRSPGPNLPKSSRLFQTQNAQGTCRVLCYSEKHDDHFSKMSIDAILKVINLWIQQIHELKPRFEWVQIFENRGGLSGASSPHPHGQIWASSYTPSIVTTEDETQRHYFDRYQTPLLIDYLEEEVNAQERIVFQNDDWLIVVPYWASWPYETLLAPTSKLSCLTELNDRQKKSLAEALKTIVSKYDKIFNCTFPYSMGWHYAPRGGEKDLYWQLHAHFYPPLLRSASIPKFMVGYEQLAEHQRDLTCEASAEKMRNL